MKHTVLPDGQPPTVALTVLAQLCGPKANETEMGATLFAKNGEGRKFAFEFFILGIVDPTRCPNATTCIMLLNFALLQAKAEGNK